MSGVVAQAITHVVRRGLEQYPTTTIDVNNHFNTSQPDAPLELSNTAMGVIAIIAIVTVLLVASVDYTVGSVIASLAMIESPSTTTIVESAPPAYNDEPDATLEKKGYTEDIEVVVVNHKPITSSVIGTIKHLHRVGGFFGRWRGLFQHFVYATVQNVSGHMLGGLFSRTMGVLPGQGLGYVVSTVALCRLHMLWTHAMVSAPANARWYTRFVPRKQSKAVLLPALARALAQQATLVLPFVFTAIVMAVPFKPNPHGIFSTNGWMVSRVILNFLAFPVALIAVILFILIPATVTLARIEACLLPEDQQTIVPFDREAIMGDIDLTQRCSSKKLYVAAYKSITRATRARIVKIYVKLWAFQFAIVMIALHLIVATLYYADKAQFVRVVKDATTELKGLGL